MPEANAELTLHGTALAGDSRRSYQEALNNALDKANNNQTFVQPTPCPFTFR
jgi:flavin-binding protein dodecin